jgi:hypothetical protein
MRQIVLVGLVLALSPAAAGAEVAIAHEGVSCVVAERFPRFEARIDPAAEVADARVRFRPAGGLHWYSVRMKREGETFVGVLPQPKKGLQSFSYYIEVTGSALQSARTDEHAPVVADGPAGCRGKLAAGLLNTAQVTLERAVGAPPIPAGFSPVGVVAGGSAVAGATAEAAAAGGGIGKVALVVGGLAAVGGAAVAAGGGGGGDTGTSASSSPSSTGAASSGTTGTAPSTSPTPAPSPGTGPSIYSVVFAPLLDVSACAGRQLTWSSQVISVDAAGSFDSIWAPNEPNTARITGRLDASSFSANLSCFSGSNATTLQASGSGGSYAGSFTFGGRGGTFTVVLRPGN